MAKTKFLWDPVDDCVLSELDGTDSITATYTNEPQRFGGVLSQRQGLTTSTLHADALGSTRLATDAEENETDAYHYDAWGEVRSAVGQTVLPFTWNGYHGYYTNSSTDDLYVRIRAYSPIVARWRSVDPYPPDANSNLFEYCNSSPIAYSDPSGACPVPSNCDDMWNSLWNDELRGIWDKYAFSLGTKCPPPKYKCCDEIRVAGIDLPDSDPCKDCTSKTSGGMTPPKLPGGRSQLIFCNQDRAFGTDDERRSLLLTMIHEFSHALDACLWSLYGDPKNISCAANMCSEIRANRAAGQCRDNAPTRRKGETEEQCILRRVLISSADFCIGLGRVKKIAQIKKLMKEHYCTGCYHCRTIVRRPKPYPW